MVGDETMRLDRGQFRFLASRAPGRLTLSVVAGILGGAAHALLIPVLLLSMSADDPVLDALTPREAITLGPWEIEEPRFALAFLLLCGFAVAARALSQVIFGQVSVRAASDLRLYFAERIRRLPIASLEQIGAARLTGAMLVDVTRMVEGASNFPVLLVNASTVLCALLFISLLHVEIFLLIIGVILIGAISYRIPVMLGSRYVSRAFDLRDQVHTCVESQVYGAKELKLNAQKYDLLMEKEMRRHERGILSNMWRGNLIVYLAVQYGNTIGFLATGFVVFAAASHYGLQNDALAAIVMAMIYVVGPMAVIVNTLPALLQGGVALRKINALLANMPEEHQGAYSPPFRPDQVRLDAVMYRYPGGNFVVGPVSLTLRRGQITFIVGGNGSGKSTLAKMISCHYTPTEGHILFDDTPLNALNIHRARHAISAIYLDFHLFADLLTHRPDDEVKAAHYLQRLGLSAKVTIRDGRFSTTDLSDGQRKRLALLVAMLDDRDIYVLDEWAADQDPEFRQVFYTELLPELRARDKIVVVISHDDRYFGYADQLIRMEHGRALSVVEGAILPSESGTVGFFQGRGPVG